MTKSYFFGENQMKAPLKLLFYLLPLCSCGNPMDYFNKEIARYGYIPYTTPLQSAGTGTLIGGSPKSMSLVAPPSTCFPAKNADGSEAVVRLRDETTLPQKNEKFTINLDIKAKFLQGLAVGSPSISAGISMKDVKTIETEFKGVHIEYVDSVKLIDFYRNHMSETCKEYLDIVGFIVQAIAADEMRFTFYHQNDTRITLTLDNISQYLSLSADINWKIEQHATLVITTPKFIGYQLGSLRLKDNGLVMQRATKTRFNRWVFKDMKVFSDKQNSVTAKNAENFIEDEQFFKNLEEAQDLAIDFEE